MSSEQRNAVGGNRAKWDPMLKVWKLVEEDDVPMRRHVDTIETAHKNVNSKPLMLTVEKDIREAVNSYVTDYGVQSTINDIPLFIEEYLEDAKFAGYGLEQIDTHLQLDPHIVETWDGPNKKVKNTEKIVATISFKQKYCINTTKLIFHFILN